MTPTLVLNLLGWVFLIASWITPSLMKSKDSADKYFVGAVLSACGLGIFLSVLVIKLMS